jgi:hypothetical protein
VEFRPPQKAVRNVVHLEEGPLELAGAAAKKGTTRTLSRSAWRYAPTSEHGSALHANSSLGVCVRACVRACACVRGVRACACVCVCARVCSVWGMARSSRVLRGGRRGAHSRRRSQRLQLLARHAEVDEHDVVERVRVPQQHVLGLDVACEPMDRWTNAQRTACHAWQGT